VLRLKKVGKSLEKSQREHTDVISIVYKYLQLNLKTKVYYY